MFEIYQHDGEAALIFVNRLVRAKAAEVFLDGLCRCVAFAWRSAAPSALERSPSLLATGRMAIMRHSDASPVCRGQRIPDARDGVTSDHADQASAAVL
jgi:hypothetical protein